MVLVKLRIAPGCSGPHSAALPRACTVSFKPARLSLLPPCTPLCSLSRACSLPPWPALLVPAGPAPEPVPLQLHHTGRQLRRLGGALSAQQPALRLVPLFLVLAKLAVLGTKLSACRRAAPPASLPSTCARQSRGALPCSLSRSSSQSVLTPSCISAAYFSKAASVASSEATCQLQPLPRSPLLLPGRR